MRSLLAAICFGFMLALLVLAILSFQQGQPERGGVAVAIAAVFGAAGVTFRRGE